MEIDEYRDYEKALAALKEAQRYLSKSKVADRDTKLQQLGERIEVAERCALLWALFGHAEDPEPRMGKGTAEGYVRAQLRRETWGAMVRFYNGRPGPPSSSACQHGVRGSPGEAWRLLCNRQWSLRSGLMDSVDTF